MRSSYAQFSVTMYRPWRLPQRDRLWAMQKMKRVRLCEDVCRVMWRMMRRGCARFRRSLFPDPASFPFVSLFPADTNLFRDPLHRHFLESADSQL